MAPKKPARMPGVGARSYRGRQLSRIAFPLGGIGTGTVSVGGCGNLLDWELFNRPSKGLSLENSFFAVWARAEGRPAVCRILEADPVVPGMASGGSQPPVAPGLPRIKDAVFSSRYPFARVSLSDPELPVQAKLEAFSPFVPLKDIDSGLPAAVFLWTLTNPGRKKVEASIAASLLNPIGLDGNEREVSRKNPAFGGNLNELIHESHMWGVRMSSSKYGENDQRHGTMALGTLWPRVSVVTRWPALGGWDWWDLRALWDDFAEDGGLKGPSDAVPTAEGQSDGSTLCAMMELQPGESLTVPFFLAWHFPNRVVDWHDEPEVRGKTIKNYYSTWFKDSWGVMKYLTQEFERLHRESRAFEEAFHSSTLPSEVLESAGNQLATLRSTTCFRDGEGRFFGFEGAGERRGCCPMNCTHVWNYAQTVAILFPDLEKSAREVDFTINTRPGGDMAFRTLVPPSGDVLWKHAPAADGQMGTIVRLYREWQSTGDDAMVRRLWPRVREALEYAWTQWDADRDGVMEGVQHNTFDVEFYGANPMVGTLYLAALLAGEEMARAVGEAELAREYRKLFEMGSQRISDRLWNGEYFFQDAEAAAGKPSQVGSGCLTDQLLGQWMAHNNGLGYLLPADRVKKTLSSIFRYNFRPSLSGHVNTARVYASGSEAGTVNCSWPKGGRPPAPMPYSDEVWTGSEYQFAAHLVYEGMVKEALQVLAAVRARHDGERRNPFNEPECGDHYVRGMSSWSLIQAFAGQRWSAPAGFLRFVPAVPAKRTRIFLATGTAWGVAEEGVVGKKGLVAFRVYDGMLRLRRLRLSPQFRRLDRVWMEPSGTFLKGRFERQRDDSQVEFDSLVELQKGQALILSLGM